MFVVWLSEKVIIIMSRPSSIPKIDTGYEPNLEQGLAGAAREQGLPAANVAVPNVGDEFDFITEPSVIAVEQQSGTSSPVRQPMPK